MVHRVFKGEETPSIPLYFLLADPDKESKINDIVGITCWFKAFSAFLEQGGPFSRDEASFTDWAEKLDVNAYPWPSIDELREETLSKVTQVVNRHSDKFTQAEFLGPTEYSESACAPRSKRLGALSLIHHHFDFAVLTKIASKKADDLHQRFFEILKEIVKSVVECEGVDSVRVADDFCNYRGALYSPKFVKKSILPRQIELAKIVRKNGKYAVLHADGDITTYLEMLSKHFDAFHPLDLRPKPTINDANVWAEEVGKLRQRIRENVFITGVPVDLLCNREISPAELTNMVRYFVEKVSKRRLILANTHRPYPGWTMRDIMDKMESIRRFAQMFSS